MNLLIGLLILYTSEFNKSKYTSTLLQDQLKKQNDEVHIMKKKLKEDAIIKETVVQELKLEHNKNCKFSMSKSICYANNQIV
jgi:hypothetical protein